jgi:8-oxo-dGTP pyrophosphatase MutT (NUDIX family)
MDGLLWVPCYGRSVAALAAMVRRVSGKRPVMLPPDQYVASLNRKRMAASAFLRDMSGRVLIVDPTYKPTWDLPGGAVEAEESPHAACRREVAEELGLDRPPGRVLAVDWVPSRPERPEGLVVLYDGGILSTAEIDGIVLGDGELAGFMFAGPDGVAARVTPLLSRRIAACLKAVAAGTVAALENGSPTPWS